MDGRTKNPKLSWLSKLFAWMKSGKHTRHDSRVVAESSPLQTTAHQPEYKITSVNKHSNNGRVLKVVAVCGSLRKASYNMGLIRAAIEIAKESIPGMEIELLDISKLPFLNTDLEVEGRFPEAVEEFRKGFLGADCILFSTPEYNYSVTGPLKNAIDWASRNPNVMAGKPAAIMSVAGFLGGARAQYHLRQIGVYLDLHFINKPEVFVSGSQPPKKFDEDGNLIDEATRERVKRLLLALHSFALNLLIDNFELDGFS